MYVECLNVLLLMLFVPNAGIFSLFLSVIHHWMHT